MGKGSTMRQAGQHPGLAALALLVGVVAVAVYLNGLPGDFVFDDKLIQHDPRVVGKVGFWTIFRTDYWFGMPGASQDLYRPLTTASYALNRAVSGLSSPAFHLVNVVLHGLGSALVVALVDVLLRDRTLAVVSGLVFATHPIHTEAVTGIVGRAEVLSALFLLVALYVHARDYTPWGWPRGAWLAVALVAYGCALLSKETALIGVALLPVLDWVRAGGSETPAALVRDPRRWRVWALWTVPLAGFLIARWLVLGRFGPVPPPRDYYLLVGQPMTTRLLTALDIFVVYLRLLLYPATLSADYSYRQLPLRHALDSPLPVVGAVAAACLVAALVWAIRRRTLPVVLGIGFFAIAYVPFSNLALPIGVLVGERLMYLPSVGFSVLLAWVGTTLARRLVPEAAPPWARAIPAGALAATVVLYGARTYRRNLDWRNAETLYRATVQAAPECHAARFNYAAVLLQQNRPGANVLALEQLQKAYAIRSDHYPTLVNLATAYFRVGERAQARRIAMEGLALQPDSKLLQNLIGVIDGPRAGAR